MPAAVKTTSINIRTDEETKNSFSKLCNDLGLSVSSALNMIMKSSARNKTIPVELSTIKKPPALDDYTDEELLASLEESRQQYLRGETKPVEDFIKEMEKW